MAWTLDAYGQLQPEGFMNFGQVPQAGAVPELPPDPMMLASAPPALPQTPALPIPQDPNSPLAGLNLQNQAPLAAQAVQAPPDDGKTVKGPDFIDQGKSALKKIGNLTPEQVKSIQGMTGMTQRPALPAAAAAIPRGQTGQMQQFGMAAPRERKTLAQLIGMR